LISIRKGLAIVIVVGDERRLRVCRVYIGIIMIWIRIVLTMTTRAGAISIPISITTRSLTAAQVIVVVVEVTHYNECDTKLAQSNVLTRRNDRSQTDQIVD
jgi:hypothetical protein